MIATGAAADRVPIAQHGRYAVVAVAAVVVFAAAQARVVASLHGVPRMPFVIAAAAQFVAVVGMGWLLRSQTGSRRVALGAVGLWFALGWLLPGRTDAGGVLGSWQVAHGSAIAASAAVALLAAAYLPPILVRRKPTNRPTVIYGAGIALGLIVVVSVARARNVGEPVSLDRSVVLVAAGYALAGSRRLVLPAICVAAAGVPPVIAYLAEPTALAFPVRDAVFALLLVAAATSWRPAAWALSTATPLALWLAVNVLNIADAVLTAIARGRGNALEANPVINVIGLPAKVAGGAVISTLILRHRPAALALPCVALITVLAWHIVGGFTA